MLRPFIEITIGNNTFKAVTNVQIETAWNTFTDTCELSFPNKFRRDGETLIAGNSNIFRRGDEVTIKAGYFPNLTTIFQGFVAGVMPDSPLILKCEDLMWKLKQENITISFKQVTLSELLEATVNVPFEAVDASLGQFRIKNATIPQVLEELKKTYGLVSYIRNNTLKVGLAFDPSNRREAIFDFEKNIIDSSGLEYRREDDVKIKVKAISILPDNTKLEVEVGDPSGDIRTLTFYDIRSEQELIDIAERELPKLKYEGFFGSFVTFGEPTMNHGDVVNFFSRRFPEKNGKYLINSVIRNFGLNGYRQTINIDRRIGDV